MVDTIVILYSFIWMGQWVIHIYSYKAHHTAPYLSRFPQKTALYSILKVFKCTVVVVASLSHMLYLSSLVTRYSLVIKSYANLIQLLFQNQRWNGKTTIFKLSGSWSTASRPTMTRQNAPRSSFPTSGQIMHNENQQNDMLQGIEKHRCRMPTELP